MQSYTLHLLCFVLLCVTYPVRAADFDVLLVEPDSGSDLNRGSLIAPHLQGMLLGTPGYTGSSASVVDPGNCLAEGAYATLSAAVNFRNALQNNDLEAVVMIPNDYWMDNFPKAAFEGVLATTQEVLEAGKTPYLFQTDDVNNTNYNNQKKHLYRMGAGAGIRVVPAAATVRSASGGMTHDRRAYLMAAAIYHKLTGLHAHNDSSYRPVGISTSTDAQTAVNTVASEDMASAAGTHYAESDNIHLTGRVVYRYLDDATLTSIIDQFTDRGKTVTGIGFVYDGTSTEGGFRHHVNSGINALRGFRGAPTNTGGSRILDSSDNNAGAFVNHPNRLIMAYARSVNNSFSPANQSLLIPIEFDRHFGGDQSVGGIFTGVNRLYERTSSHIFNNSSIKSIPFHLMMARWSKIDPDAQMTSDSEHATGDLNNTFGFGAVTSVIGAPTGPSNTKSAAYVGWNLVRELAFMSDEGEFTPEAPDLEITTALLPSINSASPLNVQLTATGGTAPYTWEEVSFDGLPDGITLTSDGLLTGYPTRIEDTVYLVFKVKDANGAISKKSLLLDVQVEAPAFTSHPSSQTINDRENVTFTVVVQGVLYPSLQWQKDGVNLVDDAHFSGVNTETLTLADARLADAGQYRCVAINAQGQAMSQPATLTVNFVNDVPVGGSDVFITPVSTPAGTVLGSVPFTDADVLDTHSFVITAGNTDNAFSVNGNGELVVANALSFANQPYELTVSVTDANGLSSDANIRVTLLDVASGFESLEVYWGFNDADMIASTLDEIAGIEGSINGSAVYTVDQGGRTGQLGDYALDFGTTTNGQHVRVDDVDWLNAASADDNLTVSFWQKLHQTANTTSFWATSPSAGGTRGLQLHAPWGNNVIFYNSGQNGSSNTSFDASGLVTWTDWNHIAIVKRGSNLEIWLNGVRRTNSGGKPLLKTDLTNLGIGARSNGNESIRGVIDDFSIYSAALSEASIQQLAGGLVPFNTAPVVNDSSASVLTDAVVGAYVTTVDATDPGGISSYTIIAGNTGNAFEIDDSGNITVAAPLDVSTIASYHLQIEVTDSEGLTGAATVVISVLNPFDVFLEARWQLDETTGTVAADSSGNARHATVSGGVTVGQTGQVDGAFEFDGVDGRLQATGYKGVSGGASRTVTAWMKTTASQAEIIHWGRTNRDGQRWTLHVHNHVSGGVLRLNIHKGSVVGSTVVNDGQWHHVAVVFENDGTPDINEAQLYVDGVLETLSSTDSGLVRTSPNVSDVIIGNGFDGSLDDVRIYSTALTVSDLAFLAAPSAEGVGFDSWLNTNYPTLTGNDALPGADPEGDGLVNLLEFALGLDPTSGSLNENIPVLGGSVTEEGEGYLTISYRRRVGGTGTTGVNYTVDGITYRVEVSTNLAGDSWQSGAGVVQAHGSVEDNGDGTETVTVRSLTPISSEGRAFLRLVVEEN